MQICKIQFSRAGAAENMAVDAVMLEVSGDLGQVMWRLYGWNEPSVTFGYSQKWQTIRTFTYGFDATCIRRMTGGGIVDHRNDLTYALALPGSHFLYRAPALEIYRRLHQNIAEILLDLGILAGLQPCGKTCDDSNPSASGVCFQSAQPYDVINKASGMKLAGAAMKRNRDGILIQGSLSIKGLPGVSRHVFEQEFEGALARWLKADIVEFKGTLSVEKLLGELEKYSSQDWNQKR